MPWWVGHYLREAAGLAAIAAVLALIVAALAFIHMPTAREGELAEGEVLGFHGILVKGGPDNVVLASVRLANGRIQNVAVPTGSAASECRAGDRIRLVLRGRRLVAHASGCAPLNPRSG